MAGDSLVCNKTCQRGLQNLLILLESRVTFDSNPDNLCLQTRNSLS